MRTARWALAVWRAGRALRAHPDRVAAAYRRRVHPHAHARHPALTPVEGPLGKRRQGLARRIDRDAAGLIDTRELAPRLTHLRQRVTTLEAHAHQLAEEAVLPPELPRSIGRLEDVAAQGQDGREDADWTGSREMIRALVKRVAVDHDQVQVGCRGDHRPGDLDPEKKVCTIIGGVLSPQHHVPHGG